MLANNILLWYNTSNTHMKKSTSRQRARKIHPSLGVIALSVIALSLILSPLHGGNVSHHALAVSIHSDSVLGRLSSRLHRSAGSNVSSEQALALLEKRAKFVTHKTRVHLLLDGKEVGSGTIALKDHPSWIVIDASGMSPTLSLDEKGVSHGIIELLSKHARPPSDCTIESIEPDKYDVLRTEPKCIAESGVVFDQNIAVLDLMEALHTNASDTTIVLQTVEGKLHVAEKFNISFPDVLGVGESNFKGSPLGRSKNVIKAIEQHVNGVVVPAGGIFSFNALLGPRVTQGNGWAMALGIFEGGELRMTPGGGICQTSTTVYRAILNAGLPIVKQRNHSLFVHYYEVGGVGLDATVFYDHQDLEFLNDTGSPILIQAKVIGNDVKVTFRGTSDGRTTRLEGPFVPGNDTGILVKGRRLYSSEIAWKRFVTKADGAQTEELLVSRYKAVPNYVRKEILKSTEMAIKP